MDRNFKAYRNWKSPNFLVSSKTFLESISIKCVYFTVTVFYYEFKNKTVSLSGKTCVTSMFYSYFVLKLSVFFIKKRNEQYVEESLFLLELTIWNQICSRMCEYRHSSATRIITNVAFSIIKGTDEKCLTPKCLLRMIIWYNPRRNRFFLNF